MGSGVLRFPIFWDEGLEKFCRWHLTDLHTTDQCQIFNNFLIKQVARGTVALTREQTSAMGLEDFIIPERKGMQAMSVDQWNALLVFSSRGPVFFQFSVEGGALC